MSVYIYLLFAVSFVCVHDCRKNILLAADDLYGSLVGILAELLCENITYLVELIAKMKD